eukprot:1189496-Prorocentrum_minimum.AAC.4
MAFRSEDQKLKHGEGLDESTKTAALHPSAVDDIERMEHSLSASWAATTRTCCTAVSKKKHNFASTIPRGKRKTVIGKARWEFSDRSASSDTEVEDFWKVREPLCVH